VEEIRRKTKMESPKEKKREARPLKSTMKGGAKIEAIDPAPIKDVSY